MPDSLERLLNTPVIKDGGVYYVYELLFNNSNRIFLINSLYENIYEPHSDNGLWVDDVITTMEEERLGKEIEAMENILNSEELHVDEKENSEEIQEILKEIESTVLRDNNNNLVSAEYEGEIFIPKQTKDGWIFIYSYDKTVKRFFYDSLYRCYKEEDWEIKQGENEKIVQTIETIYRGSSYIPLKKTTTTDKKYKDQIYNDKGYLLTEDNYKLVQNKEKDLTNKYKEYSLSLKYDSENRVIESNIIEYKYIDDKDLDYSFNKKYLYKYNKDDIPPDFDYYENEILKMSNKYNSKMNYTSEIYFADGFSVSSIYEDNKLKKEIFTVYGKEERIKNYE